MGGDIHPPALDVRHARAIFSLLSFRSEYVDTCLVRFSFNQLCMRYAQSNGGRYARAIKKIVRELLDSYIRITDTKTNVVHVYRLTERIDFEERPPRRRDSKLALSGQQEIWSNSCELSPEFAGLLSNCPAADACRGIWNANVLFFGNGVVAGDNHVLYSTWPEASCITGE